MCDNRSGSLVAPLFINEDAVTMSQDMTQQLVAAASRMETWIRDQALPLWQRVGFEPEFGANYERLLPVGQPDLEAQTRVRVQARQAFFYATAYHRGWCPDGHRLAAGLLNSDQERAALPTAGGGRTPLLDKHSSEIDTRQDLYDHAFVVLASAWCYRDVGDEAALRVAAR